VQSTDQLKIDTPEQIALELPLAGIGSRFLGLAIDTLLQWVLYFVVFLIFLGAAWAVPSIVKLGRFFQWIPESFVPALVILFIFCIYWGYFAFFEILWKGQTPGKRIAGVRAIHTSGRPINAYEAIGRNLLRAIDGLPGVYGVGIVCMMLNEQHRRLGDYVAGTVVVHDKRTQETMPELNTVSPLIPRTTPYDSTQPSENIAAASSSGSQLGQITSEELVLIETFLQRRYDLDPIVRDSTAYKIATRVCTKTGLLKDPNESWEHFLEVVARQVRDTARFR
jgi:uncharacterized RDD family membrane protein YckC